MEPKFKQDEVVIYKNGDRYELGVIKRVVQHGDEYAYFVWYHMGDTAARTNERDLHKIINNYAFEIIRKKVDNYGECK